MAVSSQDIVNFLLANPGMTDAQIVSAMEQYGVSPAQMANAVGLSEGEVTARVAAVIPPNQTVQLGDTIVQPVYSQTGSGENLQIGPIENVISYKADENKVGGEYTQYTPTGEVERIGTQQKVDSGLKEFALGAGALFGAPYLLDALGGGSVAGTAGGTAFDLANAGIAGGTSAFTPAQLAAIEAGQSAYTGTGLLTGAQGVPLSELLPGASNLATATNVADVVAGADAGLLTGAPTGLSLAELSGTAGGAITPTATGALTAAGTTIPTTAATALTAEELAKKAATSVIGSELAKKVADTASTASGLFQTTGSLIQSQESKEAAQKAASDITKATQTAQEAAQFRPVGMTTRFGTSQYTYDPVTGRMTSAGYQLSPEAKAAQDRLVALAGRGLTQAEQAQQQFAPLQQGATNLFNLGNRYISQSPEQVAQDYINKQMALLQPSREMELANLQNRLQQQGRAGLSVAQGGTLGATTPELQALYNARAQQELQLAANAQQAGQQNTLFGAGLLGQGAQAMGNYYGGQTQAYQPFTTALGQVQGLETAAQQPLTMGANLAQLASTAGARAGALGLEGTNIAGRYLTGNDATFNPYASLLTTAGNPNSMFGQSVAKYLAGQAATPYDALSSTKYGDGLAGYEKMIADIYGT